MARTMALPAVSVACVREKPSHAAELGSQVLMGVPVEIIENLGDWSEVETIDGYHGYIINNSLEHLAPERYDDWRRAPRAIYTHLGQGIVWDSTQADQQLSDIVPGSIVELLGEEGSLTRVMLPDGRMGYMATDELTPLDQWAAQPYDQQLMIDYASALTGTPYLWGGTSAKSLDCSGLTWTAAWLNGRLLPRNASAQARIGARIDDPSTLQPGNLLFFGRQPSGRVNHVAIATGSGEYIESSGRVRLSRLDPQIKTEGQSYLFATDISSLFPLILTDKASVIFDTK